MPSATTMSTVPPAVLNVIEKHFHEVIRGRIRLMNPPPEGLVLPRLEVSELPVPGRPAWFRVPGMYGGFSYWFDFSEEAPKLITKSSSRICGGSGQKHEIDAMGSRLVAEGFV